MSVREEGAVWSEEARRAVRADVKSQERGHNGVKGIEMSNMKCSADRNGGCRVRPAVRPMIDTVETHALSQRLVPLRRLCGDT